MSDNGVVWEDLPPPGREYISWFERLQPLTERPGAWARVAEMPALSATATVTQLRQRRQRSYPPGRWEFVSRRQGAPPGRRYVYARYLGPEDGGS